MKVTNKNITTFVRNQLSKNPTWAVKALVRIFTENQTPSEQTAETVEEDNGIGFTGIDGPILSSFAKFYIQRGYLSEKQMVIIFKKLPKYHTQVIKMSNQEQLTKLVEVA